jgi:hypothetical protein
MGKESTKTLRSVDNNAAYAIVNAAYKQAVGAAAVDTLTLDDFTDTGVAFESLTMGKDKFMKALIDQVVNFYTDEAYRDEFEDPFYVESRRFANVVQMINVQAPEVQESHAWKNLAPVYNESTHAYDKVSIGTYEVNPPVTTTKYFLKSVSYELPLAITEEQETDAFKSSEDLRGFIDYVFLIVNNTLSQHRRDLSDANRNSAMAAKILYASSVGAKGIHVVNLLTEYNAQRGGSLTTVAGFLADPAACRFAAAQLQLYDKYLRNQSSLFNTEGLTKFVPRDRMVIEVNSAFENALNETAFSTTFHDELVSLPNYRSVPAWQGFGVNDAVAGTAAAAFDQVTKIDVSIDAGDVEKSGIVAFMADKLTCMHTTRQKDTVSQYFPMEHVTLYAFQSRDQFLVNLAQNAVVFTLEAPSN